MADVVLIVTMVIFSLLIILGSIYFLAYFQHPEDRNTAWFPKIVVIISICISCYDLFLLPLDVANQAGQITATGGIPMDKLSLAFYILTIIFAVWFVPFTIFFYEGLEEREDGEGDKGVGSQLKNALKWMLPTSILGGGLLVGLYFAPDVPNARIPVTLLLGTLVPESTTSIGWWTDLQSLCLPAGESGGLYGCAKFVGIQTVKVSFIVFMIAIFSFIGWILFSVYGGIGMACLPIDLINDYASRPRPIKKELYEERKKKVGEQAGILLEAGKTLSQEIKAASRSGRLGSKYQRIKNRENEFRKNVLILEYHYRRLEESYKNQGGNALFQLLELIAGILGAIISLCWFLHICLYVYPVTLGQYAISPFLNDMLIQAKDVPFFGTLLYTIFSFYLLACVFKGNLKVGMRLVFMTLHPMVMGETMMNSIVFNTGIILMAALPVSHFCSLAFGEFAKLTTTSSLFTVQVSSLNNINIGFQALIGVMLGFFGLTFIYNVYQPPYKQKENAFVEFKY